MWNLAVEEALLRSVAVGKAPCTLRLWRNPPSVIIGLFQQAALDVNLVECEKQGIPVVRRISGGGAVYHDKGNLNYTIVVNTGKFKVPENSYKLFCQGLIKGLEKLGVEAEYKPVNDICLNQKKISGTAQAQMLKGLLHHGTLLISTEIEKMDQLLIVPREKLASKRVRRVSERVTTLEREGYKFKLEEIVEAIVEGFKETLKVEFKIGELTSHEEKLVEKLYREKYCRREWNLNPVPEHQAIGLHKAEGGLIRILLTLDRGVIESLKITGDFNANPEKIERLERKLVGAKIVEARRIVEEEGEIAPRVKPEDLLTAIRKAVENIV